MQLDVLNIEGKKTGRSVTLSDVVFGGQPNDHLIYLAVKHYRAAQRQGTHQTKGRSDIAGSTRKLHKQKGTGGSRKGDIKNPLYHGGGTMFGPHPHSYRFKMNKKEKEAARISALTQKLSGNNVKVVEEIALDAPKTKTMKSALDNLAANQRKVLYITAGYEKNFFLSLRNLPGVKTITFDDINTFEIMNSNCLLFSEEAAKKLAEEAESKAGETEAEKAAPVKAEKVAKKATAKAAPKTAAKKVKTEEKAADNKAAKPAKKTNAEKKAEGGEEKDNK